MGINDGRAFTTNPCLASEARWAGSQRQVYLNINSPTATDGTDSSGPAGTCVASDDACLAYNYGYNTAIQSLSTAASQGAAAPVVWLDVETVGRCSNAFPTSGQGYWSCDQRLNAETIQGALDAIRSRGYAGGVYSTSYQWGVITGGYVPGGGQISNWIAGDQSGGDSWCSGGHDFGGGVARLLQLYPPDRYDRDRAC